MDNCEKMLDSGKHFYFKSDQQVYCILKTNNECILSCWDGDDWVGNHIKDNTAITLLEQNAITCSLQQVHMWILGIN